MYPSLYQTIRLIIYNLQYQKMSSAQLSEGRKVILFITYTAAIYICFITSSIFQEKIYKVPYPKNSSPQSSDIFIDKLTPNAISAGISCLIGFLILKEEEMNFNIPLIKLAKIATCDIIVHVCLIAALLRTNYTTLVVVNTCSLISVILVGSYCTGVRYEPQNSQIEENGQIQHENMHRNQSQKIGPQKLWICAIVCLGIIIFSLFSPSSTVQSKETVAAGGAIITIFLFGTAITIEGFRPDFVAQIKQQYHPSSIFLYFSINGMTFVIVLFASIVTWNIKYFIQFILDHDRLLIDLAAFSLLNAMGGIFGYKLVNTFRQHIYPLVSNTRKCLTVCINVIWYGHHLVKMQWFGILIVFSGIMVEIINNYNLASKILPNKNVCNKQGNHYNKIVPKQDQQYVKYDDNIGEGVEGI